MRIIGVEKNSIGEELNIKQGDELIAFNGQEITDILDYEYYNSLESFCFTVKSDGEIFEFDVEKDFDETLGLSFDDEIKVRQCKNKCLFCFIDQLPQSKSLRETLHIKDDDYRHSFISGTYITLTNLSERDIQRIISLKLSPLYVSVHSTDDNVRNRLLGIKHSAPLLPLLKRLKENGIDFHTQIVYCPDFNDDWESSILALAPLAKSLAIVPVGLTKCSNSALRPVKKEEAENVIRLVSRLSKRFLREYGTRFVFVADELYLRAEMEIPIATEYEDFLQIENGVGLIAQFEKDFTDTLTSLTENCSAKIGNISIATGVSAYPLIQEKAKILTDKFGGSINVYKIENEFFGKSVTVAGLITGQDIYNTLKNMPLGDRLILPSVMLKEFEDVFLDNMSVEELSKKLNVKIEIATSSGEGFLKAVLKERGD